MASSYNYASYHLLLADLNAYLISSDELENLSNKYNVTDISDNCILTKVQVLLITTSDCEYSAVQSYLRPLSGNTLIQYVQLKDDEFAFYVIGQYGECTSAVRKVNSEIATIHDVSLMAIECFSKLSAIFNVGTINGVGGKVTTFDVIVSESICTYKIADGTSIRKKERMTVSSLFCELFSQRPKWPKVDNRLVNHLKLIKPHLCQGTILCGPDVNERNLLTLYPSAIGIDNNCAELFTDHRVMSNHFMAVKCVSSKQDTHPTAALLAADCLEHYLNNPQLPQFLTVSKDISYCLYQEYIIEKCYYSLFWYYTCLSILALKN